jgi:hypothetical protein
MAKKVYEEINRCMDDGFELVFLEAVDPNKPRGSKYTYSEISNFSMRKATESILNGDRGKAKQYLRWVEHCKEKGGIDQGFDYEMLKKEANRSALSRLADAVIRKTKLPVVKYMLP